MAGNADVLPSVLRAAMRARLIDALPVLGEIALDPDAAPSVRIDAIRALADYGLGRADQAAIHVHAEGAQLVGIVQLPALGSGAVPPEAPAESAAAPLALPMPSDKSGA